MMNLVISITNIVMVKILLRLLETSRKTITKPYMKKYIGECDLVFTSPLF